MYICELSDKCKKYITIGIQNVMGLDYGYSKQSDETKEAIRLVFEDRVQNLNALFTDYECSELKANRVPILNK